MWSRGGGGEEGEGNPFSLRFVSPVIFRIAEPFCNQTRYTSEPSIATLQTGCTESGLTIARPTARGSVHSLCSKECVCVCGEEEEGGG